MRWMKCNVKAKSGTSLEREMKKRIDMTLFPHISIIPNQYFIPRPRISARYRRNKRKGKTNPIKLFNIQTNPNIHPTVVSPLNALQLNTKSKLKCFPATSAENNIRTVATAYQILCNNKIWERILRGGSSVSAPGRGGRRRRAMFVYVYV